MDLYSPATFGSLHLANRVVMAPLTRTRAGADGVPTGAMVRDTTTGSAPGRDSS